MVFFIEIKTAEALGRGVLFKIADFLSAVYIAVPTWRAKYLMLVMILLTILAH